MRKNKEKYPLNRHGIGGMFLVLAILISSVVVSINIGSASNIKKHGPIQYAEKNNVAPSISNVARARRIVIDQDVIIKDTVINGTIIIEKQSRVVFENVVIYGDIYMYTGYSISPFLTIKDNSKVIMKKVTFVILRRGAFIGLYNNSMLTIDYANGVLEGVGVVLAPSSYLNISNSACKFYVSGFNNSNIYVKNITAMSIFTCFNFCNIYITGNIEGQVTLYLFNNATATVEDASCSGAISITEYYYSNATIINSDLGTYSSLTLYHNSVAKIIDSHVETMTSEDLSALNVYGSSSSNAITAYSSSKLYIDGGNYGTINLLWGTRPKPTSAPGPFGTLKNINANLVYTVSARVLQIINSVINTLNYVNVYDGTFVTVDSTISADHSYINYQATGSTINLPVILTDTIVGVNLTTATINSQLINNVYTQYVQDLYVNAAGTTVVSIYTWWTENADISNLNPNTLNIFSYYSDVDLQSPTTGLTFCLYAKKGRINISGGNLGGMNSVNISESNVSIDDTYFDSGEISFYNVSGNLKSVDMSNITTEIYLLSNFTFDDVTITPYLDVMGSVVNVSNSEIYNASYEFILYDGKFNITKGLITDFTGRIFSGIYNHGNTNITGYYLIRGFLLDNVTLNITKTTLDPGKPNLDVTGGMIESMIPQEFKKNASIVGILAANKTSLYAYSIFPNTSRSIVAIAAILNSTIHVSGSNVTYIVADCDVYVNRSTVKNITATYARVNIYESAIEEMTLTYSNTMMNSSSIDKINLVMGNMVLDNCNITTELFTGDIVSFISNNTIFETNISAYDSNISTIVSLSIGNIHVENSTVQYLLYAFQHTEVVNSTVGVLLNTSLVTAGPLLVNNTRIVSGNYENLLNLSGNNMIGLMKMCISAKQDIDGDTVNVTIIDSDLFAVVMSGGYLNIDNTNVTYVLTSTDKNVSIKKSEINATVLGDKPIIFAASNLLLDNVVTISERLVMVFGDILITNSDLYEEMIVFSNSTAMVTGTRISPFNNSTVIQALFSDVTISDISIAEFILYFSSLDIYSSTIMEPTKEESGIIMSLNSTLYASNITTDNILTKPVAVFWLYSYVVPAEIYTVKFVNALVEDSTITNRYALFYLTDNYYGVTFDNGTVTGGYDLKTNYTNSNISTALPIVLFEVDDYAKAEILSYNNSYTIRSLWISCLTDTNPPEITPLNDTYVEYENGVPAHLCYILNDAESPTNYTVYLNSSEIMSGLYGKDYLLDINMNIYITDTGTYIFEVYIYDSDGNSASITTTVRVFPTENPEIIPLNGTYVEYEFGAELRLCFQLIDLSPTTYRAELNGTEIMSDIYTSGQIVTFNLCEIILDYGNYILHIEAYDKAGNMAELDTEIVVYPAEPPQITIKPEDTYIINQGESIVLNWSATDKSPDTYTVYINNSVNKTGKWTNNQIINLTFSTNIPGKYNVTIIFRDKLGQKALHTVIITVEQITTPPPTTTTTETTTGTTTTTGPTPSFGPIIYVSLGLLIAIAFAAMLIFFKKKKQETS